MKYAAVTSLLILLFSCTPRQITTVWKADPIPAGSYHRILVVAILPEEDTVLREGLETEYVHVLDDLGYQAISAMTTFGPKGLAKAGEANTYLKLCDKGIDAVMTLALIRKTAETWHQAGNAYLHPDGYYYQRIWDYKKIQADTAGITKEPEYFFENILFDLATLEAVCTIRSQPFIQANQAKIAGGLIKLATKKLLRERVLEQQAPRAYRKPF